MTGRPAPPLGAVVHTDIRERPGPRGVGYLARARWTHPRTGRREETTRTFASRARAESWLDDKQVQARTGVDRAQTLAAFCEQLGDRWARTIDSSSTFDPYSAGLRLRVLPDLGHLAVGMLTAGLIDRAIDRWEKAYSVSTVKNTVAALVLVLDEAVRDGLLPRNPAKDRARRSRVGHARTHRDGSDPRDLALPDVATLNALVVEVVARGRHQCWGDMVTLLATTAMRISEVSGLVVGDVDLDAGLMHVGRQTYPGRGGLITKTTKGRRRRVVPIIEQLRPTLARLVDGRSAGERLLTGPKGGVITTATLRDATGWDELVESLGQGSLVRHGLRHTALTWMADSGVSLYVLQRVAGHQDPAVTARYLHPDTRAVLDAGSAFSAWWGQSGDKPAGDTAPHSAGGLRETGA
jgi:integrase